MVVIKGLTMPKYCYECPCKIQCKLIDSIDIERPADCPLEEIDVIDNASTMSAKHAYILTDEDGNIKCSNCGSSECWGNYCMNCGAKMHKVT